MKVILALQLHKASTRLLLASTTLLTGLLTGCSTGSGSSGPTPTPTPGANAKVVLMLSSTANGKLTGFNVQLTGLSLKSQSGSTVSLFSSSPGQTSPEFIHLNASSEPFVTVHVPEDTYTSATVKVGSASFSCSTYVQGANGGLNNSTFVYGQTPANQVSITLPQPIVITQATGISLNLQQAPSETFGSCAAGPGIPIYSINPTFQLNQLPFGNSFNALANGEETTLTGLVSSVNSGGTSFTVAGGDGPAWNITNQANTVFQGIPSASALAVGQPVNMDIIFGTDGSIAAQRVQVLDTNTTNLSSVLGPIEFVSNVQPSLFMIGQEQQGYLYTNRFVNGGQPFGFANAVFQTSSYLTNFQQMPFVPTFTAANMVPGQNILVTSQATTLQGGPPNYVPASTVTLMPQTVNGTITNIQTAGKLTTYTVSLPPYDLFPNLANQAGQANQITSPGTMLVYVYNGNIGVQNMAVGQPFRFTGLVFNDAGILKMDCQQILAGVTV